MITLIAFFARHFTPLHVWASEELVRAFEKDARKEHCHETDLQAGR